MEPDFKTQDRSLNFSLKDPIVPQQLLTSWGRGEQSWDYSPPSRESESGPQTAHPLSLHLHTLRAVSPTARGSRHCWNAALPVSHSGNLPGYPGVVPRADSRLRVQEVHLALYRGSLLCTTQWGHGQ